MTPSLSYSNIKSCRLTTCVFLVAVVAFVFSVEFGLDASRSFADDVSERLAEVDDLEKAERWADALERCERIYDSIPTDAATRLELRRRFAMLRPKVAPNLDPEKAGVWRVRAFVFRTLDFQRQDANGETLSFKASYRDDEIERIRRGMQGFADFVWRFSDGALRIDWTLETVVSPLRRLAEVDGRYWPGPLETIPLLPEIPLRSTDTILTFVKTSDDATSDDENTPIPLLLFGGAIGEWAPITRGATYIGFNWGADAAINEPDGEPMLHEWLHSLQWALEERRLFPQGLAGNPDGGRFVGENRELDEADPCYRRNPEKEKSWIEFYRHILQTHSTRQTLREAADRDKKSVLSQD